MIGAWTINIGSRFYGPFTSERMRDFASEGRLAAHSLVAREGTTDWHEARDEPEFADLFRAPGDAGEPVLRAIAGTPAATAPRPTPKPAEHEVPRSHFAILVDKKSNAVGNIDEAVHSLGPFYRLLPNVWILTTDQTANAVRNRLVQELGKLDSLFVIDASRGKAAWFNFGPEGDAQIRRVWRKAS
jgi:GYF domain 2